jgi:hypothetical protein
MARVWEKWVAALSLPRRTMGNPFLILRHKIG